MVQHLGNEERAIQRDIARLVKFALEHKMAEEWDEVPITNALLDLLKVTEPYSGLLPDEAEKSAVGILTNILDYAVSANILEEDTTTLRDLLDAKIMGLLMPRQSEVIRQFWATAKDKSIQQATADYYQLSIDSNYIRMDRIAKNQYWLTATDYGSLEITVNLSKPEKDPKEIARERSLPQSSYPKCLLCYENVGYAGRLNHPARQNHRVIPVQLDSSRWFLQYSPYVYYNEHSIIFCEQHIPMKISGQTFTRLLDFIKQFPHYFIGSNADLPIVGGSILNHDHFQGGRHSFPMEKAKVTTAFTHPEFPQVKIGIVKWPMSVIRISSNTAEDLITMATSIYSAWQAYNDKELDIMAQSIKDDAAINHNTVTPIGRMNAEGEFELDLVLRNNRTSELHPDGIFHPHKQLHHIKKENIGLIEVMGLAVLPGRLQDEIQQIRLLLTGELSLDSRITDDQEHALFKHLAWIRQLLAVNGMSLDKDSATAVLQKEIGLKFLEVLSDAGVFKNDPIGKHGFMQFIMSIGCLQSS